MRAGLDPAAADFNGVPPHAADPLLGLYMIYIYIYMIYVYLNGNAPILINLIKYIVLL